MKILFCSPTRLDRTLGAPKVIMELAEGLTQLGCDCKLIGPADIMDGLIDGRHNPAAYGVALRDYLLKHAGEYDVVDYDHEYLPYDRSEFPATTLMVARSVLLHYHFDEIKIPTPRTPRFIASQIVRNLRGRNQHAANRVRADITGKQADLFLTLNSQDRDTLIRYGYDGSKVVVVGLGLHPPRFAALGRASLEVHATPIVAFVGTFDYRKGCLDMPKIARGVIKAIPNAKFRLIGTAGLFQTEAQVLAHFPPKLRPSIEVIARFKPDELPALLESCSAGVFPSYIEGFGFGVLEMLAAGLPVIAYDAPGPPDMLPAKYLTRRGDVAATSAALVDLLKDPVRLKQARTDSRELARSFTWSRAAQQTLDALTAARERLLSTQKITATAGSGGR
jgi:glycosyltransferase involved in cell wall biosynthesis